MKTRTIAILVVSFFVTIGCAKQETPKPRVSLHAAALQGNIEPIRQHIRVGSNLNEKDAYGSTPLIIAITFDKTDVARELIEAGADLTVKNNEGSTPLHIAAFLCRTEIVKALLDKGADKNMTNATGSTPLQAMTVPFDDVKSIYDGIGKALGPMGLELDYERIQKTRPRIAEMLR